MLENQIPAKDLAKASLFAGTLTESQTRSLEMFPFIVFKVDEVQTDYDINLNRDPENKVKSYVHYTVSFKEDMTQLDKEQISKLLTYLQGSIDTLFWSGIELKVFDKKTGKQLGE